MKTLENIQSRSRQSRQFDLAATLRRLTMPIALLTIAAGALLLLSSLGASLMGITNGYWYLSRSSAMVAYFLFWASMALGVSITNKLARVWPGGPAAFELHRHASLLGLGFAAVHVLTLLGDNYIGYNLVQILVPFASTKYEPFWVGIGQLAFYLAIPVTLSFYARKRLGTRAWRTIHGLSYGFFMLSLLHGVFSGTDSASLWTTALYWFTGSSLLLLTAYRVLIKHVQAPGNVAGLQVRSHVNREAVPMHSGQSEQLG